MGTAVDKMVSKPSALGRDSLVGLSVNIFCIGALVAWPVVGIDDFTFVGLLLGLSSDSVGNEVGRFVVSSSAEKLAQNWSSTWKHSQPKGQLLIAHGIFLLPQFELASA